jgi:hypothetical protein
MAETNSDTLSFFNDHVSCIIGVLAHRPIENGASRRNIRVLFGRHSFPHGSTPVLVTTFEPVKSDLGWNQRPAKDQEQDTSKTFRSSRELGLNGAKMGIRKQIRVLQLFRSIRGPDQVY